MTLTPEQFNKIALKEDFENYYTKSEMDNKFDQVLSAVDDVKTILHRIEHGFLSNQVAHDRFEQRITKLEKNSALRTYIRNA